MLIPTAHTLQDAAFPASFEDLPALRRLTLRQLHLLEGAPPVHGLASLTHMTLQVEIAPPPPPPVSHHTLPTCF